MPNEPRHEGFSREEIAEEYDEEIGVDPDQDKRTLPVQDGPGDHGRQIPDDEADAYAPPEEES